MTQGTVVDLVGIAMEMFRASGLASSLVTLQQPSGTFDASGAPDGLYVDIPGLIDIPCQAMPSGGAKILTAVGVRRPEEVLSTAPLHVLLDNYYPAAGTGWLGDATMPGGAIAILNGERHILMGVDHSSQHDQTRLFLQKANV